MELWRVENKRTEDGIPDFGINKWPESRYGEFFQGTWSENYDGAGFGMGSSDHEILAGLTRFCDR